jgi:WD40 repeat protein
MHEIRSSVPGVVKSVLKNPGEGVHPLETVFQIHDYSRLRAEGLLEAEYLPYIHAGTKIFIEHAPSLGPQREFRDHLLPVTCVAVSQRQGVTRILSASEDGSVRVYDLLKGGQQAVFWHPASVRCLACAPAPASEVCVTGSADGRIRVWDLASAGVEPAATWSESHHGAVICVAISPDGNFCASGGEDREIMIRDMKDGRLLYRLPSPHRGPITSVQFTPDGNLVSAGRDNTLRVWKLGRTEAELSQTLDRRSCDVAMPGVSPDGAHVLFDQGQSLRLMRLKDRCSVAILESPGEASQFSTFALFSPDDRLMTTACAAEGQLHLWRTPLAKRRASKVRNLVTRLPSTPTCACFSPDGLWLVTGTKENQVLAWPLPTAKELDHERTASLYLLERAVESGNRHVRIWAEVDNSDGRYLPGTTIDLALYPR